eukprot:scaffold598_cov318-Pavlova_lutheri.AAC.40
MSQLWVPPSLLASGVRDSVGPVLTHFEETSPAWTWRRWKLRSSFGIGPFQEKRGVRQILPPPIPGSVTADPNRFGFDPVHTFQWNGKEKGVLVGQHNPGETSGRHRAPDRSSRTSLVTGRRKRDPGSLLPPRILPLDARSMGDKGGSDDASRSAIDHAIPNGTGRRGIGVEEEENIDSNDQPVRTFRNGSPPTPRTVSRPT